MDISVETVAREVLDVVPVIMRTIRAEMRSQRGPDLNVPLFRSLHFLEHHPGASLQHLAGHLGLTSPTACKIVDHLVAHALVSRQPALSDRRKITLQLTAPGQAVLDQSQRSAQARLVELLAPLSARQCATVLEAMHTLQPLFNLEGDQHMPGQVQP
jgi:DNA-binding MarR family transcriptional regulator